MANLSNEASLDLLMNSLRLQSKDKCSTLQLPQPKMKVEGLKEEIAGIWVLNKLEV